MIIDKKSGLCSSRSFSVFERFASTDLIWEVLRGVIKGLMDSESAMAGSIELRQAMRDFEVD